MVVLDPKVKKILVYAGIGALLILFLLLNIGIFVFSRNLSREKLGSMLFDRLRKKEVARIVTPSPTPSPTPTPYPIAQGKQEYNVNSSVKGGPKMSKVIIDPLDVRMGESQMVSVVVKSTNTVTNVMVALRTDKNVITNHKLMLSSGTATDGAWSGTWKSEFIHDYLYQVIITATDTETSNSTTVTIR